MSALELPFSVSSLGGVEKDSRLFTNEVLTISTQFYQLKCHVVSTRSRRQGSLQSHM